MIRTIPLEISTCGECPFCVTIDGYATHYYFCKKYRIETKTVEDPETYESAMLEMKNWFKNICEFERTNE